MKVTLGEKIRKIRELKGFSQEYMAEKLDISQRAYSKLEREETKLDWNRITGISHVLEIDPIDLIQFDDSLIFHNCSQSGKINEIHNHFPEELKQQYEKRIKQLEDEIAFLRGALKKQL
ncbi:MAG: helix-turn-helix domain-containing protein [Paracoccus sp. (in: a-proteobacteria)]